LVKRIRYNEKVHGSLEQGNTVFFYCDAEMGKNHAPRGSLSRTNDRMRKMS